MKTTDNTTVQQNHRRQTNGYFFFTHFPYIVYICIFSKLHNENDRWRQRRQAEKRTKLPALMNDIITQNSQQNRCQGTQIPSLCPRSSMIIFIGVPIRSIVVTTRWQIQQKNRLNATPLNCAREILLQWSDEVSHGTKNYAKLFN